MSIKKEFDQFFKFTGQEPLLFLINDRKILDAIWGSKTERWFVGAFKNNSIYILHPSSYKTESSHKKEDFWTHLKHEYCHAYYLQITKSIYPIWLNEGLASFKSGKKLVLSKEDTSKLLNVFHYFDKSDKGVYLAGQYWVEYLLTKHGKAKFLNLIKKFHQGLTSQEFNKIFYSVYGFQFNKKTFIKFIK